MANWTPGEDAALAHAMEQLAGKPRDWAYCAAEVMSRSPDECEARWKRVLHPRSAKGPWTPEVSGGGCRCCQLSGGAARGGPARPPLTPARPPQARPVRVWCILPAVVMKPTRPAPPRSPPPARAPPQEDAEVIRQVQLHGATIRWSEIAKHVPGRVGKQCRERCVCAQRCGQRARARVAWHGRGVGVA